ncbi:MAG TPA: hypothetical protein VGJ18_18590 [Gemmatimonadaceae bacterium]|jgi:hypothetical protein
MTNLADDKRTAGSPVGRGSQTMENIDFDNPNEESMQLLEESWRRFCEGIALKEVPGIRAILAAHDAAAGPPAPRHWLVRPFVAFYKWFGDYH